MASSGPALQRGVSGVGRAAIFGTANEEIARILAVRAAPQRVPGSARRLRAYCRRRRSRPPVARRSPPRRPQVKSNYYLVLKTTKDSDPAELKLNHRRLSLLCHPDKNPGNAAASDASAAVNNAKDTLSNPLKKRLYDAYVTDVGASGTGTEGMSYPEWEAAAAAHPVKLPKWLEKALGVPVLGQVLGLLILLLIGLPLAILALCVLLIVLVLMVVMEIVCCPIRCCARAAGRGAPSAADAAADAGYADVEAPRQAEATRV
jgi:hypothetical protein